SKNVDIKANFLLLAITALRIAGLGTPWAPGLWLKYAGKQARRAIPSWRDRLPTHSPRNEPGRKCNGLIQGCQWS
ncbi:MAG: hypothetical protein ACR2QH_06570, partial [Geminicoccaceae bacterium]